MINAHLYHLSFNILTKKAKLTDQWIEYSPSDATVRMVDILLGSFKYSLVFERESDGIDSFEPAISNPGRLTN